MNEKFLVVDLETDSLDINTANITWIGLYDGKNVEILKYNEKTKQYLHNKILLCDKIITYNGNNFDIPILKNHGILSNKDFHNNIYLYKGIDIYEIIKKRATLLFPEGFESLSLDNVSKKLFKNKTDEKLKIDYNLFKKKNLTEKEIKEIENYTKQDLLLTWKIWEFLLEKFKDFADFIKPEDVKKLYHIKASSATFGYKAICYKAGIEEKWGNNNEKQDKFDGAYVMQPIKESSKGEILYLDFASLYPMIYVHNNLFSFDCDCCTEKEKWHGNKKWKLNGYYCKKQQGKIEKVIKDFFILRKKYKEINDTREQAIKIILNSIYGSSSRPAFKQIYSKYIASDCTSLGQQIIKYSIKQLEENKLGIVLMSDTDSIMLELSDNKTKNECLSFIKKMSKEISNNFPFPWNEFNLRLEDEIKYVQFFIGKDKTLNKKWYLYVNKNNKLVIKGMDIIQRSCSKLSVLIYENYLKKQIIEKLDCKFDKEYIEKLVINEINKDISILIKRFTIKNNYKSKTSIYYQILKTYGDNEQFLIKNFKFGAGKKVKYCSIKESKQLQFNDLDLSDIWKELNPFIKKEIKKQLKLGDFGITKHNYHNIQ